MTSTVLNVSNLSAGYGGGTVLRDINVEVRKGECIAVLGRNGAGKTTLLRAISGLIPIYHGSIEFLGQRIEKSRPARRAASGLIQVLDSKGIFHDQTVIDNLMLGAHRRKPGDYLHDLESHIYQKFPVLRTKAKRTASTLSGGEQQMLAVARALLARPKLLVLDEPSLGLAPILVQQLFATLRSLKEEGVTILVVEQMARQALEIADRAYVLVNGRVQVNGTKDDLVRSEAFSHLTV